MTPNPTAVQVLRNSLDRFLAKDMKGWTELCDENVVAELPRILESHRVPGSVGWEPIRCLGEVTWPATMPSHQPKPLIALLFASSSS